MFIWKPIYRPRDISANRCNFFNAFIWENKSYNSFRLIVYMSALICKKQDVETMNYSKNVLIMFNFVYFNLQDVCSVEFTNHSWKRQHWQHHFFISEAKSSNILSMPKGTASTFGLPPRIDFIIWKCRFNILWLPLLVTNTTALYNLLKNYIITCFNELIF